MNIGLRRSQASWRKSPTLSLSLGFFICQQGCRGSQLLGFARHGWSRCTVCPKAASWDSEMGSPALEGPHLLCTAFLPASHGGTSAHITRGSGKQDRRWLLSGSPELGGSEPATSSRT